MATMSEGMATNIGQNKDGCWTKWQNRMDDNYADSNTIKQFVSMSSSMMVCRRKEKFLFFFYFVGFFFILFFFFFQSYYKGYSLHDYKLKNT
jgi:hypothetical protein